MEKNYLFKNNSYCIYPDNIIEGRGKYYTSDGISLISNNTLFHPGKEVKWTPEMDFSIIANCSSSCE